MPQQSSSQHLYLVMGGRVRDTRSLEFQDPEGIHVAGVYSTHDAAIEAWRANAQRTVDDAEMKYVIVDLQKFFDPGTP